jgi:PKD repeat protein
MNLRSQSRLPTSGAGPSTWRFRRWLASAILLGCWLGAASCSLLFTRAPHAAFLASPAEGVAPLVVTFDASGSYDPDGSLVTYRWAFGDGASGQGMTTVHQYARPGVYAVRLTVEDDDGRVNSTELTVSASPATNYAIVLGIATYYYAPCLHFVDDDARAVRQALLSSPDWDPENVVLLLDTEATTWNLRAALDDLEGADENDLLFLFFSGHGGRVPDDRPGEEADGFDEVLYLYDSAYVSDDALERYLANVPMRRIAVMIDSCFSGGHLGTTAGPSAANDWAADWSADLRRLRQNRPRDLDSLTKSLVAVTASREAEYSWESAALGHGVFTYALLEALAGAGDHAGAYIVPRVAELIAAIGEEQRPLMLDLCTGELEFFRLPSP